MKKKLPCVGKAAGDGHWIQNAIGNHGRGALHRALGLDESKPIPAGRMAEARTSSNPHIRRMAALADTLKTLK